MSCLDLFVFGCSIKWHPKLEIIYLENFLKKFMMIYYPLSKMRKFAKTKFFSKVEVKVLGIFS